LQEGEIIKAHVVYITLTELLTGQQPEVMLTTPVREKHVHIEVDLQHG